MCLLNGLVHFTTRGYVHFVWWTQKWFPLWKAISIWRLTSIKTTTIKQKVCKAKMRSSTKTSKKRCTIVWREKRCGKKNQGGARVWVYARMELCEQHRNYVFSDENIYVHCNNSYNELSGNCADFSTSLNRSPDSTLLQLQRLDI